MDSETKMNVANALIWVSVITCALAIASIIGMLCVSTDSPKEMQTDIQVDVLAILVTVLIGWNILNYMQFKDSMKKIAQEEVKSVTEDYKAILNGLTMLNGKNAILAGNCSFLIDNGFTSLEKVLCCENKALNSFAIEYIMDFIYNVFNNFSEKDKVEIYKDKKFEYKFLIDKIEYKKKYKIVHFIDISKEVEKNNQPIYFGDAMQNEIKWETIE